MAEMGFHKNENKQIPLWKRSKLHYSQLKSKYFFYILL